mmetsp:Transcript_8787/g.23768  ORF Transcript_8787/g.23768 Transcript_8787/m.23768 type:complete len:97 (-) Transcript_8787:893-1183(-)
MPGDMDGARLGEVEGEADALKAAENFSGENGNGKGPIIPPGLGTKVGSGIDAGSGLVLVASKGIFTELDWPLSAVLERCRAPPLCSNPPSDTLLLL